MEICVTGAQEFDFCVKIHKNDGSYLKYDQNYASKFFFCTTNT